jgi:hypothetical protein
MSIFTGCPAVEIISVLHDADRLPSARQAHGSACQWKNRLMLPVIRLMVLDAATKVSQAFYNRTLFNPSWYQEHSSNCILFILDTPSFPFWHSKSSDRIVYLRWLVSWASVPVYIKIVEVIVLLDSGILLYELQDSVVQDFAGFAQICKIRILRAYEHRCSVVNIPGKPMFDSQPEGKLSWLGFSWFSQSIHTNSGMLT